MSCCNVLLKTEEKRQNRFSSFRTIEAKKERSLCSENDGETDWESDSGGDLPDFVGVHSSDWPRHHRVLLHL